MFRYSCGESLFFIFLTTHCIFNFIIFVGSFRNLQNCLALSMFIHFSVYLPSSMMTIPLPLSRCSSILCSFLDNEFITLLSLYDTSIVLYFLRALLDFFFEM